MRKVRQTAGAGSGAAQCLPDLDLGEACDELVATREARPFNASGASSVRVDYEHLVVLDQLLLTISLPMDIARATAWNEISRGVVMHVEVEVISHDGVTCESFTGLPEKDAAAPMAWMRPRPNRLVQNDPANGHDTRRRSERMVRGALHTSARRLLDVVASRARREITSLRAEAIRPTCISAGDRFSAMFASIHPPTLAYVREQNGH